MDASPDDIPSRAQRAPPPPTQPAPTNDSVLRGFLWSTAGISGASVILDVLGLMSSPGHGSAAHGAAWTAASLGAIGAWLLTVLVGFMSVGRRFGAGAILALVVLLVALVALFFVNLDFGSMLS